MTRLVILQVEAARDDRHAKGWLYGPFGNRAAIEIFEAATDEWDIAPNNRGIVVPWRHIAEANTIHLNLPDDAPPTDAAVQLPSPYQARLVSPNDRGNGATILNLYELQQIDAGRGRDAWRLAPKSPEDLSIFGACFWLITTIIAWAILSWFVLPILPPAWAIPSMAAAVLTLIPALCAVVLPYIDGAAHEDIGVISVFDRFAAGWAMALASFIASLWLWPTFVIPVMLNAANVPPPLSGINDYLGPALISAVCSTTILAVVGTVLAMLWLWRDRRRRVWNTI